MPSRRLPSVEEAHKLFKADPYKRLSEWAKEWDCSHERVRQLRDQALRRIRKGNSKAFLKEKYEGYLNALTA